jgi:hypothetical protein
MHFNILFLCIHNCEIEIWIFWHSDVIMIVIYIFAKQSGMKMTVKRLKHIAV